MKFEIRNRFTAKVQFTAEIDCAEDAPRSLKVGLAVKWALRTRANLADANLAGANLAGANLAGANLAGANLARAYKVEPDEIPVIPQIDAAIAAAIDAGGKLNMSAWHGSGGMCSTTHCRAGWAIHLGGEKGRALEAKVGSRMAGAMIYRASRPGKPAPWFFASDEAAMEDIRRCAAEQIAATKSE